MRITRKQVICFCIGLVLGYVLVANPLKATIEPISNEIDYLDIAYDLYFHPDDCEGQKIIARGLWYFIGGGEQIANYTNIDDYYNAGIVWAEEYCS